MAGDGAGSSVLSIATVAKVLGMEATGVSPGLPTLPGREAGKAGPESTPGWYLPDQQSQKIGYLNHPRAPAQWLA